MYKMTDKTTGDISLIEEKDIGSMFNPQTLGCIYDKLDEGEVYENDTLTIEVN